VLNIVRKKLKNPPQKNTEKKKENSQDIMIITVINACKSVHDVRLREKPQIWKNLNMWLQSAKLKKDQNSKINQ
jgi:hypothetical protein